MKRRTIVARYAGFAIISIGANVGCQAAANLLYGGPHAVLISMVIGTAAGLLCKYVLDKVYIFGHQAQGAQAELATFFLYSIMGLATTALFWATEYVFHVLFRADCMRYVGAVLGLTIGYAVKYQLDRKLVFK